MAARAASSSNKRIQQSEFTDKAWQAIVAGPELASEASQQMVETEHLMKALLEQPNGLARRILSKAGSNPSGLLEKTDDFIRNQPRVTGDTGSQVCCWAPMVQHKHFVSSHAGRKPCLPSHQAVGHIPKLHSRRAGNHAAILAAMRPPGDRHLTAALACCLQVLGRNLEALVTRAQEFKGKWKDEFVSVEHLVLAFLEDMRFGQKLLKNDGLDSAKLEKAIKDIRGSNRVTDQVCEHVSAPNSA